MTTRPSSTDLSRYLLLAFGFLLFMNCVIVFALYLEGEIAATGWKRFLNFDSESNLPTWFSTFLFFLCGYHLYQNRRAEDGNVSFWTILAGVFVYLGIDELAQLHEKFNRVGRSLVGYEVGEGNALLHHAWTIPYLLIFGVVGLLLLRGFLRLPYWVKWRFVLAGGVFISGAVGMEMLSGTLLADGDKTIVYYVFTTLEESLEMFGLILFNHTILQYAASRRLRPPQRITLLAEGPFVLKHSPKEVETR